MCTALNHLHRNVKRNFYHDARENAFSHSIDLKSSLEPCCWQWQSFLNVLCKGEVNTFYMCISQSCALNVSVMFNDEESLIKQHLVSNILWIHFSTYNKAICGFQQLKYLRFFRREFTRCWIFGAFKISFCLLSNLQGILDSEIQ